MWLEKWHKEFGLFLCEQLKVWKFALWLDIFVQSIQIFSWRSTEELCFMTLKSDAKFEEKLNCCLKMTRIWWILSQTLKSLQNLHFDLFFLCKVCDVWPKKVQIKLSYVTLKSDAKLEEKLTCCFKNDTNLVNFEPNTQKPSKFALWFVLFVQSLWCLT